MSSQAGLRLPPAASKPPGSSRAVETGGKRTGCSGSQGSMGEVLGAGGSSVTGLVAGLK
ncbi:hypothetical protein ACFPTY_10485 [Halomonas beimenensis]|uniref:hypothetical protein n=1 Tax=Halomonas beimenensis TaxID=475662 RepID=UPI00360A93A0